ncbi:hypothetical protein KY327_00815 [Candidatus Woesearchaeota archaeon]|nr:hypothetical protein [Candidatus Woesearchaeota archaeon]
MTTLITCLSTGKGSWGHVSRLIAQQEWEKIIIVTNEFGHERFSNEKEFTPIVVDAKKPMGELVSDIKEALSEQDIQDTEVALNMYSGSGKEHMALLAAVLKSGLGPRLIIPTDEGGTEEL